MTLDTLDLVSSAAAKIVVGTRQAVQSLRCGLLLQTDLHGWTNRDAGWVGGSGGPKDPWARWGRDPPWKGAMLGVV